MDLWIRSQCKKQLLKISKVYVNISNNGYEILSGEGIYILGRYKTEERALKVLDEIQYKLANTNYDCFKDDYAIKTNIIVYEMPKE